MEDSGTKLLDQVRTAIRRRHFAATTEKAYVGWIVRFLRHHGMKHPSEMGAAEVRDFAAHLVAEGRVAASTQNQALSALVFLYRNVLGVELKALGQLEPAKRPKRLPEVLSREQVRRLLHFVEPPHDDVAQLLYGTGMRLNEGLSLRVKDIRFDVNEIFVRAGKGDKDRSTLLPRSLRDRLKHQIDRVGELHRRDLARGGGHAPLPHAVERRSPHSSSELAWQYVFPSKRIVDDEKGRWLRAQRHPTAMQRAVQRAGREAGLSVPASCHTLRHCFATHLLEQGVDIRTIQELLGHESVRTTMIYTHVADRDALRIVSPLDE